MSNVNYSKYEFSDFLAKVDKGQVRDITIQGKNYIEGHFTNGKSFYTYEPADSVPIDQKLIDKFRANGVKFDGVSSETKMNIFLDLLLSWAPVLLLVGVWSLFIRYARGRR
jgi:cell division protease FtsH